jgi:biopolymer transport protein ExbD
MSSPFRRRARRTHRPAGHGPVNLNLVPLVDVLTSIVFFGLLTYTGVRALATLTAYDLAVAPAAETPVGTSGAAVSAPWLTLRVDRDGVSLSGRGESIERRFNGFTPETLQRVNRAVAEYGQGLPRTGGVSVIPADDLPYDDLIRVLEEVRAAGQARIALGARPRA